jgi:tRNA(adenine34) deaminase
VAAFWESLSLPWRVCLEEAWTAYCAGSIPIGAAIFAPDGTLLGRGRNRINETRAPDVVSGSPLAHAELNALISVDLSALDAHTLILYTTTEPCPLCLGALYMARLRTCYYASRDPYAGSANLLGTTPYLSRKPVRMLGPERADLELMMMAAFAESAISTIGPRAEPVFAEMRRIAPQSIEIGQRLVANGLLRRLRSDGCPPEHAWNELADFIGCPGAAGHAKQLNR